MRQATLGFEGTPTAEEVRRFWQKVQRTTPKACWIWIGAHGQNGYGKVRWRKKLYQAHRFAWFLFYGESPPDETLDHLCGTTLCVNPLHLEPCGAVDNWRRANCGWGRNEVCERGHILSGDNTWQTPEGKYMCRRCEDELDKLRPDFRASLQEYCRQGHEMTPENTYTQPGKPLPRACRTCKRERQRTRRQAKRKQT